MSRYYIDNGPFDMNKFTAEFPSVQNFDCNDYNESIVKRSKELQPTDGELSLLNDHIVRVMTVLDVLIANPDTFDPCTIEEVRQVGAFKMGTLVSNCSNAELVVIFKTLPTTLSIKLLCNRIAKELSADACVDTIEPMTTITDRGFEIYFNPEKISILISTLPTNMRYIDNKIHLDIKILQDHIIRIRHCKWFDEHSPVRPGVKDIVRLLEDLKYRFEGLEALSEWMVLFLAVHCCMANEQEVAQVIPVAFKRAIQLLSSGFYLQSSNAILDPCGSNKYPMFSHISKNDQDTVATNGQTLFRILGNGGYNEVLGLTSTYQRIGQLSVVQGVVVASSESLVHVDPKDLPLS